MQQLKVCVPESMGIGMGYCNMQVCFQILDLHKTTKVSVRELFVSSNMLYLLKILLHIEIRPPSKCALVNS